MSKESKDKLDSPSALDSTLETDKSKVDFANKDDKKDLKFYPDNPESTLAKYRFITKETSQYYDPCQESAQMSFNCLDRNNYDKSKCRAYFDAYRECKKQWLRARRQDRSQWE
ncbi:hypothetical protein Kpol_505p20 [Vanderwaltozyma polyspora DSM 70294]|uniref:Cx9C motif-containing protein 4, mitochondrial n=1 Tax=Vanderwaltozyma polyspora (strain ATCC 22028 / DSM 70294 / BCRC 21397 / CBS 2163 / NBRC 10782 / NRRL Y-8283 / UCD 57-17) TaxID=436907 RepID=A7TNB1_VANPO|nr:uncharacterized protein Kpol_505p20 [Vanderwaltozyma polyspora DSM 70294]EDO16243.1 hypothetical protein Kpol_505p20 [Vanderwaltozyma polyspora DSM 70294]